MKRFIVLMMVFFAGVVIGEDWKTYNVEANNLSNKGQYLEASKYYLKAADVCYILNAPSIQAWQLNNSSFCLIKFHLAMKDKTSKEAIELLKQAKDILGKAILIENKTKECRDKLDKNLNYVIFWLEKEKK